MTLQTDKWTVVTAQEEQVGQRVASFGGLITGYVDRTIPRSLMSYGG